jgi:REP element-mobilizing transposase RayT
MPKRQEIFQPGTYFHIYNRGVNHGEIFFEEKNYEFFLDRLVQKVFERSAKCIAYVLMPNHFHLLIQVQDENFSESMKACLISYTKAINKHYLRSGPMFEGRFRAKQVDDEAYLLVLAAYIHLNPVKAGLVTTPSEWPYSSYHAAIGLDHLDWVDHQILFDQFSYSSNEKKRNAYREFVKEWQDRLPPPIPGISS